jgi:hypothetical protein
MTYTLIDSVTLGSSAASVSFTGISATGGGDLVLVADIPATGADTYCTLRFNSDSGANYSYVNARGNGSTATSGTSSATTQTTGLGNIDSGTSGNFIHQIFDYSATDKHKSILVRTNNAASYGTQMTANRWANTAAITAMEIISFGTYPVGSTFKIYQIVSE